MVLHLISEPPSSNETKQKRKNFIDGHFIPSSYKALLGKFELIANKVQKKLIFVSDSLKKFNELAKNSILNQQYLPHAALVFLIFVVAFANFAETAKIKANSYSFVSLEPSDEENIVTTISPYTPQIQNPAIYVAKANAMGSADGFVDNNAPIDTQITARVAPDPDNSSVEIQYYVKNGETLSGISQKFGVKVATIKYVNDLSTDAIKPQQKLTISKKGYEVSATLIAQKEDARKLALASRNVVTRDTTATRTTTTTTAAASQYVAVKNGVRYIEKSWGQCYTWVQSQGYDIGGHGLARWIPTNSNTPKAGGLVVTYESAAGHVAIVESVNDDGTFTLRERNYTPGWITERNMKIDDNVIKGFVN
jgi:LysM repeat protein